MDVTEGGQTETVDSEDLRVGEEQGDPVARELARSEDGGCQPCEDVWWRQGGAGQGLGPGFGGQAVDSLGLGGPQLGEMSADQDHHVTVLSAGQLQHSRPDIASLVAGAEDCGEVLSSPHLQTGVLTPQLTHRLTVPQHHPVTTSNVSLANNQQLLLYRNVPRLAPALSASSKIIVVGIIGINESIGASDDFSKERSHRGWSENSELVMINGVKWTSNKRGTLNIILMTELLISKHKTLRAAGPAGLGEVQPVVVRGSEGCIALGALPLSRLVAGPETQTSFSNGQQHSSADLPETIITEDVKTLGQDRVLPLHFTRRTGQRLLVLPDFFL